MSLSLKKQAFSLASSENTPVLVRHHQFILLASDFFTRMTRSPTSTLSAAENSTPHNIKSQLSKNQGSFFEYIGTQDIRIPPRGPMSGVASEPIRSDEKQLDTSRHGSQAATQGQRHDRIPSSLRSEPVTSSDGGDTPVEIDISAGQKMLSAVSGSLLTSLHLPSNETPRLSRGSLIFPRTSASRHAAAKSSGSTTPPTSAWSRPRHPPPSPSNPYPLPQRPIASSTRPVERRTLRQSMDFAKSPATKGLSPCGVGSRPPSSWQSLPM